MSILARLALNPLATLVLAPALLLLAPSGASAQQRSIQLQVDISKAFEDVERNKAGFDAAVMPARKRLEDLAKKSAEFSRRMDSIPSGLAEEERLKRLRELHAQAVQTHAEYLKEASTIVNEASKLIAGNMAALDGLARRLADARHGSPDAEAIRKRIAAQTETGRQIVRELHAIRQMAAQDPALARRVNSLIASAGAIDRSITAQKLRLEANAFDGIVEDSGRVAGMVQAAVGELADMYTALEADKNLLHELKEEVELAVNLGLLDLTQEVVHKSLPTLAVPGSESVVPGLNDVIAAMRDHNRRTLRSDLVGVRQRGGGKAAAPGTTTAAPAVIPQFRNF